MFNIPILLKREFWEHRGAFKRTPMITGIVMLVLILLAYITSSQFDLKFANGTGLEFGISQLNKVDPNDIRMVIDAFMLTTASMFHLILFVVLFFYMLGSLYDDRKDGSILFWKSLPVSDTQTVFSKLITAVAVVPLLFTVFVILTHLAILVLLSLIVTFHGANPFTLIWANASLLTNWTAFVFGCVVQALWALPVYAWLTLVSAWSKRRPFLWAVFLPMMVAFAWYWYNVITQFRFLDIRILKTIGFYMGHSVAPFGSYDSEDFGFHFDPNVTTGGWLIDNMAASLMSVDVLKGLVFAVVCVALAIYIRRYRNTT